LPTLRLAINLKTAREAHIATLKTELASEKERADRATAELRGDVERSHREVELLNGQLVTERERADRGITELADERTARQTDQEQLAAARAAADKATAELVELARRLAAIAETQAAAETAETEPEPPQRSKLGRAWGWFLRN